MGRNRKAFLKFTLSILQRRNFFVSRFILSSLVILFFFQNCTNAPMSFLDLHDSTNAITKIGSSGGSGGNGGGVEGKLYGTYYRQLPKKYCQSSTNYVESISINPQDVTLVSEDVVNCELTQRTILMDDLVISKYQQDVIGYKDGVFVRSDMPDQKKYTVEAWCQQSSPQSEGFIEDLILKSSDNVKELTWFHHSLLKKSSGTITRNLHTLEFQSSDIQIQISLVNLIPHADGQFSGKAKLQSSDQVQQVSCRLGYSLDGVLWPSTLALVEKIKQIEFLEQYRRALILTQESFQNKISEILTFDFEKQSRNTIFSLPSNQSPTVISNFTLDQDRKSFLFRSDFLEYKKFELFYLSLQNPSQLTHVGRGLSIGSNLELQVSKDFSFSNFGRAVLFKDNSHWIDEQKDQNNMEYQWGQKFAPRLQLFDLDTQITTSLHGEVLSSYVGTSIFDYYAFKTNPKLVLARVGSPKFDLNIFGQNQFILLDLNLNSFQTLPISFPILPGDRYPKKWIGPWQPQTENLGQDVSGDGFIVDPDEKNFVFPVKSFVNDIEWKQFSFQDSSTIDLPVGFRPRQFVNSRFILGQCGFDRFTAPVDPTFLNCLLDLKLGTTSVWDFIKIHRQPNSSQVLFEVRTQSRRQMLKLNLLTAEIQNIASKGFQLLMIGNTLPSGDIYYLEKSESSQGSRICHLLWSSFANDCDSTELLVPSSIANFQISADLRYLFYTQDSDQDGKLELYVLSRQTGQTSLLSNTFYLYGGVVDYFLTKVSSGQPVVYFRTYNASTNQSYFFAWSIPQDFR